MKEIKRAQGSKESSLPIVIGTDTIYVHSNIVDLGNGLYEYDEIQYTYYEYLPIIMEQNQELKDNNVSAQLQIDTLFASIDNILTEMLPAMTA